MRFLVWVCSHACTRSRGLSPALGWGWEFSLVSEDGGFGRKGQLATYTELVSWCHRWVCVGGISWSIKNQTCGGEKQSFLLPCSKFLKYTHVLLSDVEKPHSGRADKKVVIKELCLYDDIAPVGENREGKTVSATGHGTTSTWCPCGFSRLGTCAPRALVWASQSLFRVRCGGAHP